MHTNPILLKRKLFTAWLQPLDNKYLDLPPVIEPTISLNYDYEKFNNGWLMNIDIGIKLNKKAAVETRSTYQLTGTEKQLYQQPALTTIITESYKYAQRKLMQLFKDYQVEKPKIARTNNFIYNRLIESFLELSQSRITMEQEAPALNERFITYQTEWKNRFFFTFTFNVLQTLFCNSFPPLNSGNKNKELFITYVPEPLYKSLYFKSRQLDKNDISLTLKEFILFYHCVDCAAQCTAGKRWDKINTYLFQCNYVMKKENAQEQKKIYLQQAQEFMQQIHQHLAESKAIISNFDEPIFWDELFE